MKTYQEMLKSILKSSGWSQQQLAMKLGVSFPTVNYWLNNKVIPRKSMQARIKDLYIARGVSYEGPIYITFLLQNATSPIYVGDEVLLFKNESGSFGEFGVVGIRRADFLNQRDVFEDCNIIFPVASASNQVADGTKSAFYIYNRIYSGAYARVMFVLNGTAIAVIENFGLEA